MRRKLKLKVLYWPLLASIAIIIALFLFGPSGDAFRFRMQNLSSNTDIGTTLSSWLPGAAKQSPDHQGGTRSLPRPRTLSQKGPFADYKTKQPVDVRDDLDASLRPRSIHSPHALRAEIDIPMEMVAEAKLFAPRLNPDEELAGVDRAPQQTAQLASMSLDGTEDSNDYDDESSGDDVDQPFSGLPADRHGLGGGWPDTPQLVAELDTLARVATS